MADMTDVAVEGANKNILDCISREADKESSSRRFAYYSGNGVAGEVWV